MKKLKEIKLALMQKTDNKNLSEDEVKLGKQNFIIKYSGTINVSELLKKAKLKCLDEDNLCEVCDMIYIDLLEFCKNIKIDSVGLWLIYKDNKIIENSIELSLLSNIKNMNIDLNPIHEFVKMSLINDK